MKKLLLLLIRVYQLTLSSLLGRQCRFYPTCSNYAFESIQLHGTLQGSYLSMRRICKCHPFHPGGVDLVPQRNIKQPASESSNEL
ncbi:MAG: membrane protein insertion efficiency factor YidD [Candidatus Azotimanducaceae bacterium]